MATNHTTNSGVYFSFDYLTKSGKLLVKGDLDKKQLSILKHYFETSKHEVSCYKLNLENVTNVDSQSIYLLFSIYQTMEGLQKPLHIDGALPLNFTRAVEESGFSRFSWLCFGQSNNR